MGPTEISSFGKDHVKVYLILLQKMYVIPSLGRFYVQNVTHNYIVAAQKYFTYLRSVMPEKDSDIKAVRIIFLEI